MTSNKRKQLFTQIYNDNINSILRLCYMYLKDRELAEDATQETFLKAYKKLNSFKELSSINTWLTAIAINTCKNIIRKSTHISDEVSLNDIQYKLYNTLDDNDIKMSVSEAVMSLSSELREVILLRFYRDLPIKDISKILSLPESTINYRLLRAKSLLKDTLKEDLFDE